MALTYDKLEPEDEKVAFVAGNEMEKIWNPFRKSRFSNPTVAGWLLIQQFSEYEYDALLTFFYFFTATQMILNQMNTMIKV